ncbi:adaptin ear-binding coat-associated protein 1 isoform X2 [Oryzias latipes]
MAAEGEYESILCVKPDVNVYRIPPRASNRAYRAADWKLDSPDWSGRMRITAKGKVAFIKLEDKVSGELFAQAPVNEYPGIAVETVSDSSRYFVLRIQDDSGRSAFIGVGFGDRGDSFDFNVTLQDHFKWVKQEIEISKNAHLGDSGPKLDLGFKDGQTITLNIGNACWIWTAVTRTQWFSPTPMQIFSGETSQLLQALFLLRPSLRAPQTGSSFDWPWP